MKDFITWAFERMNEANEIPGVKPEPDRYPTGLPVPGGVRVLHQLFSQAGFDLHIVGGAIRNHALNRPIKDYDLATNATSQESIQILQAAGFRPDLTGAAFGVVRVRVGGEEYEIASYRQDLTAGRKPETAHVRDRYVDAQRRDFTINALYHDAETGDALDHVGGWQDIQDRVVRAVGNPWERFNEDPLRVLRFLRFHNDIGGGDVGSIVDDEHRNAIRHFVDNGLRSTVSEQPQVPPERIQQEFVKGLGQARSLQTYLQSANELGILPKLVFPGLQITLDNMPQLDMHDTNPTTLSECFAHILLSNEARKVAAVLRERKYENSVIDGTTFLIGITPGSGTPGPKLDRQSLEQDPQWFKGLLARYTRGKLALPRIIPPSVLVKWANDTGMDTSLVESFANYQWQPLAAFADPESLPNGPQRSQVEMDGNFQEFLKTINS